MATAYSLKGIGAAMSYDAPGFANFKAKVNIPELIANPGLLALAASPTIGLGSFAGFVQNDTLKVALIPSGFLAVQGVLNVIDAEGATAAVNIGDSDGATVFLSAGSLNAEGEVVLTLAGAKVYAGDDYILVTFTTDDTYAVANFELAVLGQLIG